MADERYMPGALFLIAEEDFRLCTQHSAAQPRILEEVAEAAYAAGSTPLTARPAFAESLNGSAGAPAALTLDELYSWCYQVALHAGAARHLRPPRSRLRSCNS